MKRGTPGHPKMIRLAELLKIPLPYAVGIMEMLWQATAQYAPRGDIGRFDNKHIADLVRWPRQPSLLISALVESRWLDADSGTRYLVHDWEQHADRGVHEKLKNAHQRFHKVGGNSGALVGTLPVPTIDRDRDRGSSLTTEQNPTRAREEKPPALETEFEAASDMWPEGRQVWTEKREEQFLRQIGWQASPTDEQVEQVLAADGKLLAGSGADGEDPGRLRALRARLRYFDLFWRDYWRKVGKKKARELWLRVAITEDDQAMICAAADRQAPGMLAKEERFRPHAATWLGQERWNDEVAEPEEQERMLWATA